MIIAFFAKFFAKFSIQNSFSVSFVFFSSQYRSCLSCFAFFSSLTRLLQHIQKIVCKKIVCKHCEKIFDSKNKFYEHIRQHHTNKKVKTMKFRFNKERNKISSTISIISTTISSKTTSKFSIFRFVTISKQTRNLFISFVIFATTSKQMIWISSKRSRFLLFTFEIISKFVKIASTTCSLFISFATSTSKLRKSISKFYFTIHDFHRLFVEKFKRFDLRQHQNRRSFSQRFDVDLYQSRIIVYFLFAINQKTSINQNLKNSNSKNFQQHTFAKSISFCRFVLSEKSICSSYKNSNIFYISLQSRFSFLQSRFSFAWFRFTFSSTFSSFFRFSFSNHVCCICFDFLNFRNESFDYLRFNQRYFWNRQSMRKI